MSKLQLGAHQAVKNCMKITPLDNVVLVTDKKTKSISDEIEKECKKISKNVKTFVLEDFGSRPLATLPKEIEKAVRDSTAVFCLAQSMPGEKASLRMPIVRLGTIKGREAHMPDITRKLMETGMLTDYNKIKEVSKKVYNLVKNAKEIKVITSLGTNFKVNLNKDWS